MSDLMGREQFMAHAVRGDDRDRASELAAAAKLGDSDASVRLAALAVHVAAVAPSRLEPVYDAIASGWSGSPITDPRATADPVGVDPSDEWWAAFWELVDDPAVGADAGLITQRTAALAGMLGPDFVTAAAAASLDRPGVVSAAATGMPTPFTLDALARCPVGSIGADLHTVIVDNGFDLEVLDRTALGFDELPAPLGYLNARILQCHDLWHLIGGYRTTVLHEVAISGFQMGQFGHEYSSMFLAVVMTKVASTQPMAVGLMLETILSAYRHGRTTPLLLALPWEQIWDRPVDELRATYGIRPYESPFPADLIEQLSAA
jgi:ubiquinone biosynthesis protein Coq4